MKVISRPASRRQKEIIDWLRGHSDRRIFVDQDEWQYGPEPCGPGMRHPEISRPTFRAMVDHGWLVKAGAQIVCGSVTTGFGTPAEKTWPRYRQYYCLACESCGDPCADNAANCAACGASS